MKVLVIGSGGREHAIAFKISQSTLVSEVVVAPGNPGMKMTMPQLRTKNIKTDSCNELLQFALEEKFDLTIVGPEASLSKGIVDLFRQNDLLIVGATKAASELEISKAFAKQIMMAANVPTAAYAEFFDEASALLFVEKKLSEKMVVKCDGLAAGKGVIVCQSKNEAIAAVKALMSEKLLGENVEHVIIEDFLEGIEVSAFALCDGESFTFLGTACDHKRLRDGDLGPNTGGMGTFSPARCMNDEDQQWIEEFIFSPVLKEMKVRNIPFTGILFAGLMKTNSGWKVLEFNVRLGDPETQVLLPLIGEDLVPWFIASASGNLKTLPPLKRKSEKGVHVVMAAHGYPGTEGVPVRSDDFIHLDMSFDETKNEFLFFAGVKETEQGLVTGGGRVLGVTVLDETSGMARERAYEKISHIHFDGAQFRKDIGARSE
jgi:phosphoribosylamine--glycine ligase